MDEAELPHAIELLVGLLGLAAFVAIVARPLRLPYTVALVIAGLAVGIAAGAAGIPSLPAFAPPIGIAKAKLLLRGRCRSGLLHLGKHLIPADTEFIVNIRPGGRTEEEDHCDEKPGQNHIVCFSLIGIRLITRSAMCQTIAI